jgi:hypothetical protein
MAGVLMRTAQELYRAARGEGVYGHGIKANSRSHRIQIL